MSASHCCQNSNSEGCRLLAPSPQYGVVAYAGLPAFGLMVLMPADMHLSVSSSRPPTALTAALSASALPLNLSPAAVSCLVDIVNSMSAAAFAPHDSSTDSLPAQPSFTDSLSGVSVLSDEEQRHLNGNQAPPSLDDLRCGLFSMTPVLASRPGNEASACCYSGICCCFFTSELCSTAANWYASCKNADF